MGKSCPPHTRLGAQPVHCNLWRELLSRIQRPWPLPSLHISGGQATLTCTSAFLAQVPPFRALFISLTEVGKAVTETLSSTLSVFPLLSLLLGPWNSRSLLCQVPRQWGASCHLCGMSLTELCLVPFPGENGRLRRQPFSFWLLAYTTAVSEWSLDDSFQFGLLP